MQKQDSRGVLWAGFTIKDVQFIHTNRVVTHWILLEGERAVCYHSPS